MKSLKNAIRQGVKQNYFLTGLYFFYRNYFYNYKKHFGYCGKGVVLQQPLNIASPQEVFLYDNTNIYAYANISGKFIMKANSGAARGLTVMGGNHMSIVGMLNKEVTDEVKKQVWGGCETMPTDKGVIVEDDVILMSNVTLLNGVTVGRGCFVGAGTVVRKSLPPYSIVIGNPAKVIGFRFTPKEVQEHENKLYPENERISLEKYEKDYNKYFRERREEIRMFTKI